MNIIIMYYTFNIIIKKLLTYRDGMISRLIDFLEKAYRVSINRFIKTVVS